MRIFGSFFRTKNCFVYLFNKMDKVYLKTSMMSIMECMTQEENPQVLLLPWEPSIPKYLSRWYGQAQHMTEGKR